MRFIAWLLGVMLLTGAVHADTASAPYTWRNVVVGGGGFAPNIIFSPAEKGLAYLRTDMGGAYRWDDGQQRWIPRVYVGTDGRGIVYGDPTAR